MNFFIGNRYPLFPTLNPLFLPMSATNENTSRSNANAHVTLKLDVNDLTIIAFDSMRHLKKMSEIQTKIADSLEAIECVLEALHEEITFLNRAAGRSQLMKNGTAKPEAANEFWNGYERHKIPPYI